MSAPQDLAVSVAVQGASKPGMDNKGLTLSGVFGLPPRAHEDDPERALRVAVALKEQLTRSGVACSVGVASGRVFCGLFGSDLRRAYTLSGNVMNLAARLAHAGEDEILCDELTDSVPIARLHPAPELGDDVAGFDRRIYSSPSQYSTRGPGRENMIGSPAASSARTLPVSRYSTISGWFIDESMSTRTGAPVALMI